MSQYEVTIQQQFSLIALPRALFSPNISASRVWLIPSSYRRGLMTSMRELREQCRPENEIFFHLFGRFKKSLYFCTQK